MKGTTYDACMSRYQFALWEQVSAVIATLPEDKQAVTRHLQPEDMALAGHQLNSVHCIGIFAKTLMSAVAFRKHALLLYNLIPEHILKTFHLRVRDCSVMLLIPRA